MKDINRRFIKHEFNNVLADCIDFVGGRPSIKDVVTYINKGLTNAFPKEVSKLLTVDERDIEYYIKKYNFHNYLKESMDSGDSRHNVLSDAFIEEDDTIMDHVFRHSQLKMIGKNKEVIELPTDCMDTADIITMDAIIRKQNVNRMMKEYNSIKEHCLYAMAVIDQKDSIMKYLRLSEDSNTEQCVFVEKLIEELSEERELSDENGTYDTDINDTYFENENFLKSIKEYKQTRL